MGLGKGTRGADCSAQISLLSLRAAAVVEEQPRTWRENEALHFLKICTAMPRVTEMQGYRVFSCQIQVPSIGVRSKCAKLNFISLDSQCCKWDRYVFYVQEGCLWVTKQLSFLCLNSVALPLRCLKVVRCVFLQM